MFRCLWKLALYEFSSFCKFDLLNLGLKAEGVTAFQYHKTFRDDGIVEQILLIEKRYQKKNKNKFLTVRH